MRTLKEIINCAKTDDDVSHDELLYALCAMDALSSLDRYSFLKLAQQKIENKKQTLIYCPEFQFNERSKRNHIAYNKSPKEWLGNDSDPKNPEVQMRRKRMYRKWDASQ